MNFPEEFPELAGICQEAFVTSATSGTLPECSLRTTPSYGIVTMEDGEVSQGAKKTSAEAAFILAHLDEEPVPTPAPATPSTPPRCIPNHRPCNGEPAYCC
ncbi:MAG: hypothetical protein A3J37_05010 [Alphaproteobacteria bacterium RIFCSPHIGHO2_12_FULL_45_9]|nr:MAG: hypothetical protein A3B66_02715 [Alphaproteobacteria bacterium RIFCSPHIGHO2_02_FULL_46_13]OFW96840.1 MAG: hypothetical protein A3J37_05010 [Alphaproteobacteria bacterium RIFCSPHIGHO2_12_FULL_45_9]